MSASAETLLRQALRLPPIDRAALVESLITSLVSWLNSSLSDATISLRHYL